MKEDGVYAFPSVKIQDGVSVIPLRDWFAGQALPGILASMNPMAEGAWKNDSIAAEWSYSLADAMLEARKEKS